MKQHQFFLLAAATLVIGVVAGILAYRSCSIDLRFESADGKPSLMFRSAVDCTARPGP